MLNRKRKKILFIAAIAIVLVAWMVWSNVTVGTTHYTVTSNRLPASFDHYKIVIVSDVHNAEFGVNNSWLIRQIKKESPDIIAITGDLVDSSKTDIEIAGKLVHQLVEIAPCYYVVKQHNAVLGTGKGDHLRFTDSLLDSRLFVRYIRWGRLRAFCLRGQRFCRLRIGSGRNGFRLSFFRLGDGFREVCFYSRYSGYQPQTQNQCQQQAEKSFGVGFHGVPPF